MTSKPSSPVLKPPLCRSPLHRLDAPGEEQEAKEAADTLVAEEAAGRLERAGPPVKAGPLVTRGPGTEFVMLVRGCVLF